jgi:DNA-binding response OmpR family regulator
MTRILVVDDEPQILRALRINLRARQYDVDTAADGAAALRAASHHHPDLVVLDLGLPDMEGADVIRGLRGWTAVPIIVLSGRVDSADKVQALDASADDYVTKPFGIGELLARVRAVTRRTQLAGEVAPVVTIGRHTIDLAARSITGGDTEVRLTPDRVAAARAPAAASRQTAQPARPATRRLGAAISHREQLPAPVHGPAAPQTRDRPRASAASADRAWHGLPLQALSSRWR